MPRTSRQRSLAVAAAGLASFTRQTTLVLPRFTTHAGRELPPGERYVVFDGSERHWGVDEYDVANQGLVSHHFEARNGAWQKSSGPFRYVWPAELDLMAELAAMRLVERWSGWHREPFTGESRQHVSVWETAGS